LSVVIPHLPLLLAWLAQTVWNGFLVIGSLLIFLVIDIPKQLLGKYKSDHQNND
jgi:Trk-type K+ transport system membrane component